MKFTLFQIKFNHLTNKDNLFQFNRWIWFSKSWIWSIKSKIFRCRIYSGRMQKTVMRKVRALNRSDTIEINYLHQKYGIRRNFAISGYEFLMVRFVAIWSEDSSRLMIYEFASGINLILLPPLNANIKSHLCFGTYYSTWAWGRQSEGSMDHQIDSRLKIKLAQLRDVLFSDKLWMPTSAKWFNRNNARYNGRSWERFFGEISENVMENSLVYYCGVCRWRILYIWSNVNWINENLSKRIRLVGVIFTQLWNILKFYSIRTIFDLSKKCLFLYK